MNYFGKFDAKVFDALGHQPGAHVLSKTVHAAHVPSDAIVVPDAQLLFGAEFKRAGVDLVLSGNGREHVVHDYFKGEKHAPLASPDGAHLTADVVTALSGQVQYAQAAGVAGGGQIIGHVTKLVGNATAIRNGVSIILNNGDNVEKGDVVQSGSDSTLGITFIDGTVFGLSSNARMVLNEMVYDPNGSNNSSLLSLVAGTITFVAGETAKHGDMKVDTPVATMGIRGTAVLFAVHFKLPNGSFVADDLNPPSDAVPEGEFQVLQEPDGTTGSYILFEKTTLTPLAVVDRAGQQINITNGLLSQTTTPLSPEIQKLIQDVFSLKFTDNSNTKSIEHFTDTIIPNSLGPTKFALLSTLPPTGPLTNFLAAPSGPASSGPASTKGHIGEAPFFMPGGISSGSFSELANTTGSTTPDKVTGTFQFFDVNVHDLTTVSATFDSFAYTDAQGNDIKAKLNPLELADVKAVENGITVTQGGLDSNGSGTASWTYKIPDGAFDFLAAGEKLTLTFNAVVDNNYQPLDQTGQGTFTVTITGTNDAPVITTPQQNIALAIAGTGTQGGSLPAPSASTTGTLNFTDPDLTDTHSASASLVSALLNGKDIEGTTVGETVFNELKAALTATVSTATDSTGTGAGTIQWTLASLQVYLADFVPTGESLVLTYAVTVTDSQGATSTQDLVFTVTGNEPAATVWVDTTPLTNGVALWSTATNWSSGLVPSAAHNDDVLIGTDQVLPGSPTFPVTVASDASARSLTMTDFSDFKTAPELDVNSGVTLTITDTLTLNPIVTDPTIAASLAPNPESTIKNFGTINVGGVATLLAYSVLDNYGLLTLAKGGVFGDQSSITNDGTIEIKGGTLDLEVGVTNFVTTTLGTIQVDGGATLALTGGVTITSGNLTFADSSGDLAVGTGGATLDGVAVSGGGEIDIGSTTATGVTLTLDDAASVTDGKLVFADSSDKLAIGAGGATLDGAAVSGGGEIDVAVGTTLTVKNTVTLDDVTISGGEVKDLGALSVSGSSKIENAKIDGGGDVTVTGGTLTLSGVTLDSVTLAGSFMNLDTLTIDETVTLNGATISGGTVDILGELDSTGTSLITGAAIINQNLINIVSGILTIDPTPITNTGTIEVYTGAGLVLDDDAVTNSESGSNGTIQVDANATLTLEDSSITGGILDNSGTIKLTGKSSIGGLSSFVNSGTLESDGTLTLANMTIGNAGHTLKSANGGVIDLVNVTINGGTLGGKIQTVAPNISSTLSGVSLAVGTLVTAVVGILELTGNIYSSGEFDATTGVLDLDNAYVTGGTFGGGGTIATVSDFNTLNSVTIAGGTTVNVVDGAALDLVGTISDHGTMALGASGHSTGLAISSNVSLAGGGDVTMSDSSHNLIGSDGSAATLTNHDTISGAGTIGDAHLTLVNDGTIDATGSHALVIDTGVNSFTPAGIVGNLLVTNETNGVLEASSGHTLLIDDNVSNNGLIQSGSPGGHSSGYVDVTGNISGTGSIEIFNNSTVEIGGSVSSGQTVTFGAPGGPVATDGTLTLDDSKDFHGTIVGLAAGDVIGLTDLAYTSNEHAVWTQTTTANGGSGTLQIYDGLGNLESTLDLTGTYTQNQFSLVKDASHGTDVHINNYVSFSDGTINDDGVYTPQISNGGSTIELTNSQNYEASSWFDNTVHSISEFTASFDYVATVGDNPADGMAFILQNSSAGIHALGGHGGSLGYGGPDFNQTADDVTAISPSAAIELNLYAPYGQGTAFATDGGVGKYGPTGSVAFASGDQIQADISYNGSVLTETLTDLVTGATYSANYTVDLASVLGGDSAYVGFSAATGAAVSTQTISNFVFDSPTASGDVTIDSHQTLEISAATSATVNFNNSAGTTGELLLDDSKDFTGAIAGFAGDGTVANSDLIDITDLNIADVATGKTTYSDHGNGTGTLTLYNASGQALDSINFDGNYQLANFTVEDDGAGHTLIVDPPVNTNGQTPGNTTVASSSADAAANDGFAFNFGGHNHPPANDFHPDPETSPPGGPILTNLHTGSNGASDQGHFNVPLAADGHDQSGLAAFAKAHLNAHDFHFV